MAEQADEGASGKLRDFLKYFGVAAAGGAVGAAGGAALGRKFGAHLVFVSFFSQVVASKVRGKMASATLLEGNRHLIAVMGRIRKQLEAKELTKDLFVFWELYAACRLIEGAKPEEILTEQSTLSASELREVVGQFVVDNFAFSAEPAEALAGAFPEIRAAWERHSSKREAADEEARRALPSLVAAITDADIRLALERRLRASAEESKRTGGEDRALRCFVTMTAGKNRNEAVEVLTLWGKMDDKKFTNNISLFFGDGGNWEEL